jgi:hypothetical protein
MTDHLQPVGSRAQAPPTGPRDVGPALLIDGEDGAAYEAMLARIVAFVKPADVLEEFCVQEVADLLWELQRLRRLKAALIRATTRRLLQEALRPIIYSDRQPGSASEDYPNERVLAVGWAAGDRKAVERVGKLLGSVGSSIESLVAQAMASRMDEIERIDRMIVMAEQRRTAALRAVESRRARLAMQLRRVASEMERGGEGAEQAVGPERGAAPQATDVGAQRSA